MPYNTENPLHESYVMDCLPKWKSKYLYVLLHTPAIRIETESKSNFDEAIWFRYFILFFAAPSIYNELNLMDR